MRRMAMGLRRMGIAAGLAGMMILGGMMPAKAALISVDLLNPGDGLITRDTDSGLDWLDVNAVMGLSFAAVQTGFLASTYRSDHGFSIATVSQLESLFRNANAIFPFSVPGGLTQAWVAPHATLNGLVGSTRTSSTSAFSVGYVGSDDGTTIYRAGLDVYFQAQFAAVRVWTLDNPLTPQVYSPYDAQGLWLSRRTPQMSAVPLPAAGTALLLALLALSGQALRRARD